MEKIIPVRFGQSNPLGSGTIMIPGMGQNGYNSIPILKNRRIPRKMKKKIKKFLTINKTVGNKVRSQQMAKINMDHFMFFGGLHVDAWYGGLGILVKD